MKIVLSLGLLAALTACGTSKSSDKAPTAETPVVTIDKNVDTKPVKVEPKAPAKNEEIVVVKPDTDKDEPKTEKPSETEAVKTVPEAFVGFGYNTLEKSVKELCLDATVALDTGISSSAVSFSRYESYESFKDTILELQKESFLNKWAGVEFKNNFFAEESEQSLTANYVFASALITGQKRIVSSERNSTLGLVDFHNKCGNKYINSAVVGGSFITSIALNFVNSESKDNFESERLDFTKLWTALQTEATYTAEQRRVASIEITYAQIGGGGALVPNVNASDVLKCNLDNAQTVQNCLNTLQKLGNYATSNEFINSIKKDPAVFSFTLSDYPEAKK